MLSKAAILRKHGEKGRFLNSRLMRKGSHRLRFFTHMTQEPNLQDAVYISCPLSYSCPYGSASMSNVQSRGHQKSRVFVWCSFEPTSHWVPSPSPKPVGHAGSPASRGTPGRANALQDLKWTSGRKGTFRLKTGARTGQKDRSQELLVFFLNKARLAQRRETLVAQKPSWEDPLRPDLHYFHCPGHGKIRHAG